MDAIQVREPGLEAAALSDLVQAIVERTAGSRTRVIVNDRVDVALTSGAHGVHLRGDSMAPERVRSLTPPGFLVGRSARDASDAKAMDGVDYLIAGTVWPTSSKPGLMETLGSRGLGAITHATRVPVLAIGGVTLDRVPDVAAAGAAGIAAIGLFLDVGRNAHGCLAGDLTALVRELRARFDTAR